MATGKKRILFIFITLLLCLTGCEPFSDRSVSESTQSQQVEHDTQENADDTALEETAKSSIAYKDWKIKENLIEGTDNIYELIIDEWAGEEGWVIAMEPYEDQVLVLKQSMEGANSLYLVHPLSVEVKAGVELPQGIYTSENVTVDNDGCIRVANLETAEIYIYNQKLEEQSRIALKTDSAGTMALSQDRTCVYYADYERGGFFCYHVDTDETEELFSGLSFEFANGEVTGLFENDSCLVLNYYDMKKEELRYEIRKLDSGKVLYQDTAPVLNVVSGEDDYAFLREDSGLYEYIYGKNGEEMPKILSFRDYGEYNGYKHMCLRQQALFSGVQVENAQKEYQEVTGKECQQGQSVSKISFSQYDLTNGLRPYAMDFYYVQDEDEYISNYDVVYIPEADCAVCYIEASAKRWLVWDLTKESSATGDSKSYLYNWQDPAKPDEEGLKTMRERAGEIGQKYGVEIYLGDELSSCPSTDYRYEVSNNLIRIEKALDILEKALGKYPEGMLAQLETEENSRLKIYLADRILPIDEAAIDTSIGIQNTMDGITFLVLDINSWTDLENTVYHEIFHAIEIYLNMDDTAFFDYEVWNALNPEGFEYDSDYHVNEENQNWDYVAGGEGENAYFIDVYAKSYPNEDRARIMEYAMMDDTDPRKRNVRYDGIREKLRYISEQIRKGFDTNGWQEVTVWEEVLR
ncbi:MAG: hypothetical protein NC347_08465 [Clostridium sp.]|nr:hypothetical protein [Clostridium sp.]